MKKLFAILCIVSAMSFGVRAYADDVPVDPPADQTPIVDETPAPNDEAPIDQGTSDSGQDTPAPQDPPPLPTATVIIRSGDTVLYDGSVSIPAESTTDIADSTGATHPVSSRSVLALLVSLDAAHDEFAVTNLTYYSSFSSFYLKCITPSSSAELCDNWQYAVGSTTPFTSIDTTLLSGGETVGLYFGSPHRVSLSATSVTKGVSFVATAESYNYTDNTWNPLLGVTIGITVPNPNDPWSPTVVTTQAVDIDGKAMITLADAGAYSVGIVEDYYFPSYALTVTEPVIQGGGGGTMPSLVFNVPQALAYLYSAQNPDGSFGDDLYTDWAAVAYAAADASESAKNAIRAYLLSHAQASSFLTDNERRAMALLSLGENPYSFGGANYIAPIVASFDGTQFGDASLENDDVFALLPLSASGYSVSDEMIAKDIQFLVSKQRADGSWEGSIDFTAAVIQALHAFNAAPDAVAQAVAYLQSNQQSDGGFGSVYSTSWALQAGALWAKNGKTGTDYLAALQAADGAAIANSESTNNRVWGTSYAIPAALGKSWSIIMRPVVKQVLEGGASLGAPMEEAKKEEKIIELVEETKPEEIVAEPTLKALETSVVRTVAEKPQIRKDYVALQNIQQVEEARQPAEPIALMAAAGKSKTNIPAPVVAGSALGLGLLAYIAKKFLFTF